MTKSLDTGQVLRTSIGMSFLQSGLHFGGKERVIHHSGGTGQTGLTGSSVFTGRSRRVCMYVFHSSGTGVSVEYALRVTQSTSARRLLRSVRSSFHLFLTNNSCKSSSKLSRGGFSYSSGKLIESHVVP